MFTGLLDDFLLDINSTCLVRHDFGRLFINLSLTLRMVTVWMGAGEGLLVLTVAFCDTSFPVVIRFTAYKQCIRFRSIWVWLLGLYLIALLLSLNSVYSRRDTYTGAVSVARFHAGFCLSSIEVE